MTTSSSSPVAARRSASLVDAHAEPSAREPSPASTAAETASATAGANGVEATAATAQALAGGGIEEMIAARAGALLARVGDSVPDLHAAVLEQAERGLFRAVLAHTGNHLGRASKILGLDRNTCARKARQFGLVDQPSRGRKPRRTAARSGSGAKRAARGGGRRRNPS